MAPLVTPFKKNGDVDLEAMTAQVVRTAKTGMGIGQSSRSDQSPPTSRPPRLASADPCPVPYSPLAVLMGTNGEACHLSAEERSSIIKASRAALDKAGLEQTALLVGTGGSSARETIQLAKEAHAAGADHSIVITPGYFAFVMGKDQEAIYDFFVEVADNSPLPVMIVSPPPVPVRASLLLLERHKEQKLTIRSLYCLPISAVQLPVSSQPALFPAASRRGSTG